MTRSAPASIRSLPLVRWAQGCTVVVDHLQAFANLLANLLAKLLTDPYRPELHYMRGPGPKWHAKHSLARLSR
jgi:hypothetical protein